MKWKSHLINYLTLTLQITALFLAWWAKWLIMDNAPLFLAVVVLIIGITGGIIIWSQRNTEDRENRTLELTIVIIGSMIITVGVYMAFVPVVSIFMHSATASIILVLGILAPSIVPKLLPNSGVLKNA